jgi:hypothetical protein
MMNISIVISLPDIQIVDSFVGWRGFVMSL